MTDFRTVALPEDVFKVREGTFDLDVRQISTDSFLARSVKVGGLITHLWQCELQFTPSERERRQRWQAFRDGLEGQAVLFIVRAPGDELPLGQGAGYATDNDELTITGTDIPGTTILQGATSVTVHEAQVRNRTSILMQFPTDLAGETVLKPGDKFGLGGNLYRVRADVVPGDDGVARVAFRARLWKGAQKGDIVEFRQPTCRMQLMDASGGRVTLRPPNIGDYSITAREVPYLD